MFGGQQFEIHGFSLMEELGVAADHFLEPVPRARDPGLALQLVTEHGRLHVREEERLAEGDVSAVPVHNGSTQS